ncbi:enoyl-CoA hydratase/isomerase family protein [Portibacter lacus]|uniref:Enoyl-CoA hydratase/isomerase family protein n=1 Tax=Portibacter lacus TaxID=1099794 RepID=A0AA37WBI2_9BACT|nr:enoyl-CoA hydratase/isomerase family protein [Portibacter lacus]GLR15626.1 hypothetical protein GCM10007940_02410 [Portibacter lacus]
MSFKTLNIIDKGEFEICQFNNGKASALNLELISDLGQYFSSFHEKSAKGVILNGQGSIFSVGLDMKELIGQSEAETEIFFKAFFDLTLNIVKAEFPVVSAINGHSPAGGCVLAIASDYRVMADDDKYKIGLNELPVGVMPTPAIFELYSFWIGRRRAYQNLLTGRLMDPLEAKTMGLVDELVPLDQVLETAELKMKEYLSYDYKTWCGMKSNLRLNLISTMENDHTNGHISTIDHFVKNDGKSILMKKLMELSAKRK